MEWGASLYIAFLIVGGVATFALLVLADRNRRQTDALLDEAQAFLEEARRTRDDAQRLHDEIELRGLEDV